MELNFSTFTVSKDVYDRFQKLDKKYREDFFAGKRRLFNEFVIKNGCDSLLKMKGSITGRPVKEKVHLKLWFYDFILEILDTAREKLMKSSSINAGRTNEKKIMINDLLISAGCDRVMDFVKKV